MCVFINYAVNSKSAVEVIAAKFLTRIGRYVVYIAKIKVFYYGTKVCVIKRNERLIFYKLNRNG